MYQDLSELLESVYNISTWNFRGGYLINPLKFFGVNWYVGALYLLRFFIIILKRLIRYDIKKRRQCSC